MKSTRIVRTLVRQYSSGASDLSNIKFGVIGAGQMGSGIALVAAMTAKFPVILQDINQTSLDKAKDSMAKILNKNVEKNKLTAEDRDATLARITTTTKLDDFAQSNFIVEAATENTTLKLNLFKNLSAITSPDTILASNTSSISITKIASVTARPENVIGMHFMNPVPVMELVEVITGLQTSEATYNKTIDVAKLMKKTTTRAKDSPGFIANRVLMPYINEAIQALHEGIGTVEDIDTTMLLGTRVPMGPLRLADFIGLDTCLAIMRVLHNELGDSKYRPSPLLINMVDAGWLGKKSGKGFYTY